MQKRWLKDFEFHISPATWNNAQDLLQANAVKNLREVERHFWVALVEDPEGMFETEIMITPHKIKAFTCECFTEGRQLMCAHVAATLFKVRQFLDQRQEAQRAKTAAAATTEISKLTVQTALGKASPEDLLAFVRAYARRDRDFALALKTWFAGSIQEAENPFALVLDSVIPQKSQVKTIREPEFRRLRKTLEELQVQLATAVQTQHYRTVFQISAAILQKTTPLLPKIPEAKREQLLPFCELSMQGLTGLYTEPVSPELRFEIWMLLFDLGLKSLIPSELLREMIRFLSAESREEEKFDLIRAAFDTTPFPAPEFLLQLFLAALCRRDMPEAVVRVLADYIEHPQVLRESILQLYYLHYWEAVTTCIEHLLPRQVFSGAQKRELEDILYLIAEKSGDHGRQNRLLRERFVQSGQFEYFNKLKTNAAENWQAELEQILSELRAKKDLKNTAAVLAAEGRRDALERLLESQADLFGLQRYEDLFLRENRNFIRNQYTTILTQYLREHFGRQASGYVRERLAGLVAKGETELVKEIIRELIARFEERHTLSEELSELLPKSRRKEMLL